jgi:hypothetical protein
MSRLVVASGSVVEMSGRMLGLGAAGGCLRAFVLEMSPSSSSPTDYHVPPAICHLLLTDCLPIATAISRHFELLSHRETYQHCNLISAFAPVFTRARCTNVHFTVPREGSLSGVNIRTFRVACNGKMLQVHGPLQLNEPLSLVGRPSRRHCLNPHL